MFSVENMGHTINTYKILRNFNYFSKIVQQKLRGISADCVDKKSCPKCPWCVFLFKKSSLIAHFF